MARILVVEDEPTVSDVVERYLRREGYQVDAASDGVEGLRKALTEQLDLVVLDVMLPGLDGLDVCRRLRAARQTPVIMLTARAEDGDAILGLGLGADDYVRKPFSPPELVARVKAVLRRGQAEVDSVTTSFGELRIDPAARAVWRDDKVLDLTATEFDLLRHLSSHPGQVFSRERLLSSVWGYDYAGDTSTVTVHMRRLREKIERDPSTPRWLKTVWGVGYKFDGR
ncbi:MAG TPA: response regulator transcription factor [Chloroflexota bacterium]|nr:response regulator transcription factor [Chloroflexota bacterium]